jgi:D-alanyl-D-alanine carboxypeptidase/D-alanyl-D-alanine-endopeptidase (penicillin-binding protein 4)
LPAGGIDGSLAGRFSGPLKGKVFAKTGTLGESRALSGYITNAHGQTLAFAIMVDDHTPLNASDRAAMDRIVEAIAGISIE